MNRHDRRAAAVAAKGGSSAQSRAATKGTQRFLPTPAITQSFPPKPVTTLVPVAVTGKDYNFYDLTTNWSDVIPYLEDPEAKAILAADFSYYTFGRWGIEYDPNKLPADYEVHDNREHAASAPPYWQFFKEGACHWTVNFNLRLANLVLPDRQWRIVTSPDHSTVWDGNTTLFDFLGMALFGNADKTFHMARGGKTLEIGEHLNKEYATPSVFDLAYRMGNDFDGFLRRIPVPLRPGYIVLRKSYETWQRLINTSDGPDDRTHYEVFWRDKRNIAMLKSLVPPI